jgi:lipopolysaccharide transport system permease protein
MEKSYYHIVIEPNRSEKNYWTDLWRFRELFYILSWRDIKVRYKQTVIGVIWAFVRPFLTMIIFTIVFGRVAGMKSEGTAPYALTVFAGLLPWQFFSTAFLNASESLITNSNLLSKVYFPRLIVPTSAIITSFVDFTISFAILIVLMAYYKYLPDWQILYLPGFILLTFLQSFGFGLYLAALNVKFRDFRYVVPFIVQIGLYISPVGFSSSVIPEKWKILYYLNPMVSVIDGFRWCIIGKSAANPFNAYFALSMGITILMLIYAIYKFRKMEKTFADLI